MLIKASTWASVKHTFRWEMSAKQFTKNVSVSQGMKSACICISSANDLVDDAGAVDGMPISLQLIARRLEEEKVIAMVRQILQIIA